MMNCSSLARRPVSSFNYSCYANMDNYIKSSNVLKTIWFLTYNHSLNFTCKTIVFTGKTVLDRYGLMGGISQPGIREARNVGRN